MGWWWDLGLPHSAPWTGRHLVALSSAWAQFRSNPYRENIGTAWVSYHRMYWPAIAALSLALSGNSSQFIFNLPRMVIWCQECRCKCGIPGKDSPAMQVMTHSTSKKLTSDLSLVKWSHRLAGHWVLLEHNIRIIISQVFRSTITTLQPVEQQTNRLRPCFLDLTSTNLTLKQ